MPVRHAQLLHQLHRLVSPADAEADAELLGRFLRRRDEDAFAALVRRHGPLVLGMCRRTVGDLHTAQDAFQATFLALARQAGTIRRPSALAAWLYGTARRIALKARAAAGRRRALDLPQGAASPTDARPDPLSQLTARELLLILDEEVQRLPEAYRLAVILCCLEGKTRDEAARQMGCTIGTLRGRLERGRARLHAQLVRRGLTLAAALAACEAAEGTLTAGLLASTTKAALAFGTTSAAEVPVEAARLAGEVLRGAGLTKLKLALALMLAVGLAALGAGALRPPPRAESPGDVPKQAAQPDAKPSRPRTDLCGDLLPPGALMRLGTVRFRQGGRVNGIAFSPDGYVVASAGWDETVRLWHASTGKELRELGPHDAAAVSVAFSADGKLVATGTWFGSAYLWDATSGKQLHKVPGSRGGVTAVAFSPDSTTLAVGGSAFDNVRLVDVVTGKERSSFSGGQPSLPSQNMPDTSVAFSPDGKVLAAAHAGVVRLWTVDTGKLDRQLKGHGRQVYAVAFAPDGKVLACGGHDGTIRLWDFARGEELHKINATDRKGCINSLAFSADGKVLASSGGEVFRLWDVATGTELCRGGGNRPGLRSDVFCVALSSKGQLAVGLHNGMVRTWKPFDIEKLVRPGVAAPEPGWGDDYLGREDGHQEAVESVSVSPDGKIAATAGNDRAVRHWDLATGKELRRFTGTSATFSPDGRMFATHSNDGPVCLRELPSGKIVHQFAGCCPTFAPDGKLVASVSPAEGKPWASGYCDIVLRAAATGEDVRRLRGIPGTVRCLAFSPDGKTLASGANGERTEGKNLAQAPPVVNTIRLWDVASGQERFQFGGDKDSVYAIAFAPDGRSLASGSYIPGGGYKKGAPSNAPVRIWETATGQERAQLHGHQAWVTSVAFSPDGRFVAAGGFDCTVRLWGLMTAKEVQVFEGHRAMVTAIAFAPDGKALISTSSDTTGLVWAMPAHDPTPAPPPPPLSPEELERAWADLATCDAARAFQAISRLASVGAQAMPLLRERLRPVRLPGGDVAQVIEALGDDDFNVRTRAARTLEAMGEGAGPALRKALGNQQSLESRRRVEQLLAKVETEALRAARAVEVLECLATAQARQVLHELGQGAPGARQTRAARVALDRLEERATVAP